MRRSMVAVLEGRETGTENERSEDGGSSHRYARSRSMAMSAVFSATTSVNSSHTSVLQRAYAADLQLVRDNAKREQNQAKQQRICNFIDYAASGDVERVAEEIARGDINVDEGDYDQRTALHLAVCGGHVEMVRALVEKHGAAISVKDRFGHTPMDDAVREQHLELARFLMDRGARYQVDADVAAELCQAAFSADLPKLELLLEVVGVDPNTADYDRRTALHLAASEGHVEVIELLVQLPGINLSPRDRLGNTPLDDAMRHRRHEARKLLQKHGGTMGDQQVGVILCTLGARNDWERLKELAESGVPMSEGDYDARTSLHLAASEGKLEAATYLLNEAGINPNPLDRFLRTPLDDAVRHGKQAVQSVLREHGGLSGSDPGMREEVQRFRDWQEGERERKEQDKLERELRSTEVHRLADGIQRFLEHATLEEDVHNYVAHAAAFRSLLLRLLQQNALSEVPVGEAESESAKPDSGLTKEAMERLLEQAAVEMDASGSRLVAVLEAELLPWTGTLSKAEARLLRLYAPGLREALLRLRDKLKARSQLNRAARKLWSEGAEAADGRGHGTYHCPPLGLLAQRLADGQSQMVCESRLDAVAMLSVARQPPTEEAEAPKSVPEAAGKAAEGNQALAASLALRLMLA